MGREARWNARLPPHARDERRIARAAAGVTDVPTLRQALAGIAEGPRADILRMMEPYLPFVLSDAQRRWLHEQWAREEGAK